MKDRYVAYIGSYSYIGKARGITICDVESSFRERRWMWIILPT